MNLTTFCKTASLVFILTIICESGYLTAQTREPNIRIDSSIVGGGLDDLLFSVEGDFLFLVFDDSFEDVIWRYDLNQRRFDSHILIPRADTYTINSDGTKFAYVDYETRDVQVISFESGDVLHTLPYPAASEDNLSLYDPQIMFSGDASNLFLFHSWYSTNTLYVADITSNVWRVLPIKEDHIKNYALSSNGRVAFTIEDWNTPGFVYFKVLSEVQTLDEAKIFTTSVRIFDKHTDDRNSDSIDNFSFSSDGTKILLREKKKDNVDVWHLLDSETLTTLGKSWVSPIGGWLTIETKKHAEVDAGWLGNRPIALYKSLGGSAGFTIFDVGEQSVLFSQSGIYPENIAFSSMAGHLAFGNSRTGVIEVYLGGTPKEKTEHLAPRLVPQIQHNGPLDGLTISGDSRGVAMAGSDDWISLWDCTSGHMFRRLSCDNISIESVALSQNGLQLMINYYHVSEIWDVTSGELRQRISNTFNGGPGDDLIFGTFLGDDTHALICSRLSGCRVVESFSENKSDTKLQIDYNEDYGCSAVSLAPDERSIALECWHRTKDIKGIGWMNLNADGHMQFIEIPIPEGTWVTTVAALENARVVAGLSNGDILLIDAAKEKIVKTLRTRILDIGPIIHLDNERFAIASSGKKKYFVSSPDNRPPEILIISSKDLSVLQRLPWGPLTDDVGIPGTERLAASDDGRWLVSASGPKQRSLGQPLVQVWDTAISQNTETLTSKVIPVTRVEFDIEGNYLLADSHEYATLWHIKSGQIMRQFRHLYSEELSKFATLDDNTLVYLSSDGLSVKSWSPNTGLRDHTVLDSTYISPNPSGLSTDGSRIALSRNHLGLVLLSLEERHENQTRRIDRSFLEEFYLFADRILLNLGQSAIEAIDASTAESIWLRDDINSIYNGTIMFTADSTGVILKTVKEGNMSLLVLEAETGKTRFSRPIPLKRYVPVYSEVGAQGLLGSQGLLHSFEGGIERLSLNDGTVIDTLNIVTGIPKYAVADREGKYLVLTYSDKVVLWYNNYKKFELIEGVSAYQVVGVSHSNTYKIESVAFSSDGRLLAIAETDGTVSLWDVSLGPNNLRFIARLITFVNGDWAVVAPDGRYDASDPADLDGLVWVMPDAPTKPVPLTIFYREYYEPGLLPRLLAGEEFPPIPSIGSLNRTQPQVAIVGIESAGTNRVNVSVEVKESGTEGVQDLKLFRDGRLVGLNDLAERPPDLDQGDAWQVTFQNIELSTSGSDTIAFSAYAFNDDGIKSETHRLPFTRPSVEPNPRRAFVIAVGVNAYQNQSWDLRYAAEDARATRDIIARYIEASDEFEEVHTVSLITDRDGSGAITGIATREALLTVLDALAGETIDPDLLHLIPGATSLSKAGPDDLVYLAFSGHGLSGDNGLFHLFLSDIGEGEKREVNSALLSRTLDSDLLARHLRQVDAGDFVMIVDACNSAASVEGGGFKPGPMGSRGLGQLAYDKAMRVLAASQAEAVALESERLRHGLLTFAMLHEGLAGGAADRAPTDSTIVFSELLNYGVDRVPLLYEDIRSGNFTPQGRGLTAAFTPNGQVTAPTSTQRPSLFDFSRTERELRLPVLNQVD